MKLREVELIAERFSQLDNKTSFVNHIAFVITNVNLPRRKLILFKYIKINIKIGK